MRFFRRQDARGFSVAKHAKFSDWERRFHAAVTRTGGERSWIRAAVSLSMTTIGPPHLGQSQSGLGCVEAEVSGSVSSARQRPFPHLTRSVRRAGGFVLTGDPEVIPS